MSEVLSKIRLFSSSHNNHQLTQFSSPYVVKIRKDRASRRLEEVDLETGRRRSWVETTEHDVIDLTGAGETPAKPRTPLARIGVNSGELLLPNKSKTSDAGKKRLRSPLPTFESSLAFFKTQTGETNAQLPSISAHRKGRESIRH